MCSPWSTSVRHSAARPACWDNTVIYTPTLDFVGTDTFTYTVSDGRFDTAGTVNVIVAKLLFRIYIPIQRVIGPLPTRLK